jgi:hypothetical protein
LPIFRDPEYSDTRIRHLQLTVTTFRQVEADCGDRSSYNNLSFDLAEAIVRDHLSQKHKLIDSTGDQLQGILQHPEVQAVSTQLGLLERIITERVSWFRSVRDWESALKWVDLLLLSSSAHANSGEAVLEKADILFQLKRYEDALKLSHECCQVAYGSEAILMMFKAALDVRSPSEAAQILLNNQRRHVMHVTNNRPETYDTSLRLQDMSILLMCCKSAFATGELKCYPCILSVLDEWLSQFLSFRLWKVKSKAENRESDPPRLLAVLWEYLQITFVYNASIGKESKICPPISSTATASATSPNNYNRMVSEQHVPNVEANTVSLDLQRKQPALPPLVGSPPVTDENIADNVGIEISSDVDGLKRKRSGSTSPTHVEIVFKSPRKEDDSAFSYGRKSITDTNKTPGSEKLDGINISIQDDKISHTTPVNDSTFAVKSSSVLAEKKQPAIRPIESFFMQNDQEYHFSSFEVWRALLVRVGDAMKLCSLEAGEMQLLGNDDDLQKIGDIMWNLGKVFLSSHTTVGNNTDSCPLHEKLALSSSFFEVINHNNVFLDLFGPAVIFVFVMYIKVACTAYSLISTAASTTGIKNQVLLKQIVSTFYN